MQKDIQDIMRQITSSVTFLPSLEEQCASLLSDSFRRPGRARRGPPSRGRCDRSRTLSTSSSTDVFTILTYAKKDTEVPKEWIDSDPHMIIGNAEQVRLLVLLLSPRLSGRLLTLAPLLGPAGPPSLVLDQPPQGAGSRRVSARAGRALSLSPPPFSSFASAPSSAAPCLPLLLLQRRSASY